MQETHVYVPTGSFSSEKKKALNTKKLEAAGMLKTASANSKMKDPYPNSMLTLSDMNIPNNMKEVFKWCRYFYKFDPLITGSINNLATFPVSEIFFDDVKDTPDGDDSDQLKLYERVITDSLEIHKLLIEIGIDYWLYGNCFIFGEFKYTDKDKKDKSSIEWKTMVRLDPTKMSIDVDPLTQKKTYNWTVPERIKTICKTKKPRNKYDEIPELIKKAVKDKKDVILNSENIYHFKRASESGDGSVWGTPVVLNVLKLLMYRNVLRQSQEAIAREHIVPRRVYYLNPTNDYNAQPDMMNTSAEAFADQLIQASKDPNYEVVAPCPVGVITAGGQGRALLLTPEIEQVQAEILAGMGIPREFLFGGVSWSGSSISLRILENHFITYRMLLSDFLNNFVVKGMAKKRGEWESHQDNESIVKAKLASLKMQDDIQQKQIMINLAREGKIPDEEVYNVLELDPDNTRDQLEKEMMTKIELEAKAQIKQIQTNLEVQKAQMKAQLMLKVFETQLMENTDIGQYVTQKEMEQMHEQQVAQMQAQQQMQQQQAQGQQAQGHDQFSDPQSQEELMAMQQQIQQQEEEATRQSQGVNQEDIHNKALSIAKKLLNVSEEERDIFLSRLPESLQQLVIEYLNHLLELAEREQAEAPPEDIDMRPLPEQRPPRRETPSI